MNHPRGGVTGIEPEVTKSEREVWLLQRKELRIGKGLGKTTGWTHRLTLARRGVKMFESVSYIKIDDQGLHIKRQNQLDLIPADTIIVCAGQLSQRNLYDEMIAQEHPSVEFIGGAFKAAELDAKAVACHLQSGRYFEFVLAPIWSWDMGRRLKPEEIIAKLREV